jgi:hypothetical protein
MIKKLMWKKTCQIGGLILFIALYSVIGVVACFKGLPAGGLTILETVCLVCSIILLNTMFLCLGFSAISEIEMTDKEINKLEEELKRARNKEQEHDIN